MAGEDGVAIEHDYREPVATLLTLGDMREQPRYDYRSLGLGEGDVAELARMAVDPDLYWGDSESDEVWAPIHAWRALADLRAEAAIDPLVAVLSLPATRESDDATSYDDWVGEELPEAIAAIGPAAFPALADYLRDPGHQHWARTTAAEGIRKIVARHPELRDAAVAVFTEVVETTTEHPGATTEGDEILNGSLIDDLIELKAVESAPVIERAFAAERVDPMFVGDWEDVQVDLGLLDERTTPARNYIREAMFGDTPLAEVDRLLDRLGAIAGWDGSELDDEGEGWADPDDEPYADDGPRYSGPNLAQVQRQQSAAKQKAKTKRKMAQQSKKQNRKKRK